MRVDPEETEHGQEEQPARVRPRLGQDQELQREPDQGEVEAPVRRHDAGEAEGEQQHDGDDPSAPSPERSGVGGTRHQARSPEDDGVEAVCRRAERPEQRRQGDLGTPFVGDPAMVRLRVAEGVEPHEGMVRQHPLAGSERPELVVGEVVRACHGRDEGDTEDDADDFDRPLRDPRPGWGNVRWAPSCGGGAGRRYIQGLDDPGARLHCSPLAPVPHRPPSVHGTARTDTPKSPHGCDRVASFSRWAAAPAP